MAERADQPHSEPELDQADQPDEPPSAEAEPDEEPGCSVEGGVVRL
jgi:hypothetical protein